MARELSNLQDQIHQMKEANAQLKNEKLEFEPELEVSVVELLYNFPYFDNLPAYMFVNFI